MSDDDDLLNDLFPHRESNEKIANILGKAPPVTDPCLTAFIQKIVSGGGFDPEAFKLAIASIGNTVENPLPKVKNTLVDLAIGVLGRIVFWIYVFIIIGLIVLAWLMVAANIVEWGLALIFSVFIIIVGIFIGFLSAYFARTFVSNKSEELEAYLQYWANTYGPLLPSALHQALCVYSCPPNGDCVTGAGCSTCISTESKKNR